MQIPLMIINSLYDLLDGYGEAPSKMHKDLFINWYSKGWIYKFNLELNTMLFHCEKPFNCKVILKPEYPNNIDKCKKINDALLDFSEKYCNILLFW